MTTFIKISKIYTKTYLLMKKTILSIFLLLSVCSKVYSQSCCSVITTTKTNNPFACLTSKANETLPNSTLKFNQLLQGGYYFTGKDVLSNINKAKSLSKGHFSYDGSLVRIFSYTSPSLNLVTASDGSINLPNSIFTIENFMIDDACTVLSSWKITSKQVQCPTTPCPFVVSQEIGSSFSFDLNKLTTISF